MSTAQSRIQLTVVMYADIIKEKVGGLLFFKSIPDGSAVFQDDGATIHKAAVSRVAVAESFNSSLAETFHLSLAETFHSSLAETFHLSLAETFNSSVDYMDSGSNNGRCMAKRECLGRCPGPSCTKEVN